MRRLLDAEMAALVLGCAPSTVRRFALEGTLTNVYRGKPRKDGRQGRLLFDLDEVSALAARRQDH